MLYAVSIERMERRVIVVDTATPLDAIKRAEYHGEWQATSVTTEATQPPYYAEVVWRCALCETPQLDEGDTSVFEETGLCETCYADAAADERHERVLEHDPRIIGAPQHGA